MMISIENGVTFDSRVARGSGELVAITVTHRTVLGTRRLFMACVPRTGPIVWPHSESIDSIIRDGASMLEHQSSIHRSNRRRN